MAYPGAVRAKIHCMDIADTFFLDVLHGSAALCPEGLFGRQIEFARKRYAYVKS